MWEVKNYSEAIKELRGIQSTRKETRISQFGEKYFIDHLEPNFTSNNIDISFQ